MNGIIVDQEQINKLRSKQIKSMLFFDFPLPKIMQSQPLALVQQTKNQIKCIGLISFKLWRNLHTGMITGKREYGYQFYDLILFERERDVEFQSKNDSWLYHISIKS